MGKFPSLRTTVLGGNVNDQFKPPDDSYTKAIKKHLAPFSGNPSSKEFMKAAFDVLSKKPPTSEKLPDNFSFSTNRKPAAMRRLTSLRNRNRSRSNRRTGNK